MGALMRAEGRRRLALAFARVNDEQALLDGFGGDFRILRGLALLHLLFVALVFGFGHGRSALISLWSSGSGGGGLQGQGEACRDEENFVRNPSDHLIEHALGIPEAPSERRRGHDPSPTSFETTVNGLHRSERRNQGLALSSHVPLGEHHVREPERQAVDQHGPAESGSAADGANEVQGRMERFPVRTSACLMAGDSMGHLLVPGLGGRDVDFASWKRIEPGLRERTLARARAPKISVRRGRGGGGAEVISTQPEG